jgi:hypothetical protein
MLGQKGCLGGQAHYLQKNKSEKFSKFNDKAGVFFEKAKKFFEFFNPG